MLLFMPGIYFNLKFTIFAFNCVTVLLILIESYRFSNKNSKSVVIQNLNSYFKRYCDKREKEDSSVIISHILLLMGCAFPPTASFILLSGGFMNLPFILISLSGVLFLGIGDTVAAIGGI